MGAQRNHKVSHILCTIDFSEFTASVLQAGITLATRLNAALTVFHAVYQPRDALYDDRASGRDPSLRKQAGQAEKQITALMASSSVTWRAVVAIGEPVEELEGVIAKKETDLVVAASYGFSGFKRMILGTVVERMARVLACPLLIIRSGETIVDKPEEYRKILVACDLWRQPDELISRALTLATGNDTEFYLLHANESPLDEGVVDPTQAPYQQVQHAMQTNQAEQLMSAIPAWARDRFIFTPVLHPGPPDEALAKVTTKTEPDLIVVGVKKRRLKRFFIGSTTEHIIRRAGCAVLTVPLLEKNR